MTMTPEDWTRRRTRLSHEMLRSRLNLNLRSLRRMTLGEVQRTEMKILVTEAEGLAKQVVLEVSELLSQLTTAMSPKHFVPVLPLSDHRAREVGALVAEAAEFLWMETSHVAYLIRETNSAGRDLIETLSQLRTFCLSRSGSDANWSALVDGCERASNRLSLWLAALPKNPGLCFARVSFEDLIVEEN